MGYQTHYELSVETSDEQAKAIGAAVRAFDGPYEIAYGRYGEFCNWSFDARFWDDVKEMGKLSLEYPELLFEIEAQGDDVDDRWKEYYKNGKHLLCRSHIVYDPFVEENMVSCEEEYLNGQT